MAASAADWAGLPIELLLTVMDKLLDLSDYIRFFSVCRRWRSMEEELDDPITKNELQILKACHSKLPVLMLQSATTATGDDRVRDLFCPGDGFIYHLMLPSPSYRWTVGSSLGWLLTVVDGTKITLLNPFTARKEIILPNFEDPFADQNEVLYGDYDPYHITMGIRKGVLSSDPSGEFDLVVIHGRRRRRLAWFKSTTATWTFFTQYGVYDAIFSDGRLYALGITIFGRGQGRLSSWKTTLFQVDFDSSKFLIVSETTHVGCPAADNAYLVISEEGRLLMVHEFRGSNNRLYFKAFVLWNGGVWFEINDLGNRALFLGRNQCVCVSIVEFPMVYPNCIYYSAYCFYNRCREISESST